MDGHQYMIPMQWFTQYLYYNKDLFKAAGIEKAPDTWDEMAYDAAKITNPDKRSIWRRVLRIRWCDLDGFHDPFQWRQDSFR